MEIELKLTLPPQDVRALGRHPVLVAATRSKPASRTLHSVYFDTPDRLLARRNMALRLRRSRNRWTQTFKCGGGTHVGMHEREEFEAPAPGGQLNVPALLETPLAPLLADPSFLSQLAPAFVTEFRRQSRAVEIAPGETAEFAVDIGEIRAGGRVAPISEIEIELLSGNARNVFAFARGLAEAFDLRLENASKAERGYALMQALPLQPVRAAQPALAADETVIDAFRGIVGSCVAQLQANERGVLESDDPEFVHQARVAIRRLRSAFSLFRRVVPREAVAGVTGPFRDLATALGEARDWDVFATQTLPPIRHAFPSEASLARLDEAAASCRSAAQARAREVLASRRTTTVLLDLAVLLVDAPWRAGLDETAQVLEAMPLSAFAAAVLRRQAKRARKQGRVTNRDDMPGLHALRIEIKKLRYAVEFFASLSARKTVRRRLAGAAELQEMLGHLNDAAVTAHLLERLVEGNTDLSFAAGIIRGWSEGRAEAGLDRFDTAWKRFARIDFDD